MSEYFKNQGVLTISLETSFNLGGAEVKRILYTKPNGATGFWTATASGTALTYNLSNSDIDQGGRWVLQAYVEISGEKGYGDLTTQRFNTPIL